jgi:hypothetical protein
MKTTKILTFLFIILFQQAHSQTTHVVYFDSTNTIGNTDTTLTVIIGDSIVIIHNQDDDDFDVLINNTTAIGAYNISYGNPIYGVNLTNDTINSIKVEYYDPLQYRLINLNYTSLSVNEINSELGVSIYPNPICSNTTLTIENVNNFDQIQIFSIKGELEAAYNLLDSSELKIDLGPGSYILKACNSNDGIFINQKLIVL